jgi:hypothetical protein
MVVVAGLFAVMVGLPVAVLFVVAAASSWLLSMAAAFLLYVLNSAFMTAVQVAGAAIALVFIQVQAHDLLPRFSLLASRSSLLASRNHQRRRSSRTASSEQRQADHSFTSPAAARSEHGYVCGSSCTRDVWP